MDYLGSIDEVMTPFLKAHVDGKGDIESYKIFEEDLVYYSRRLRFGFVYVVYSKSIFSLIVYFIQYNRSHQHFKSLGQIVST